MTFIANLPTVDPQSVRDGAALWDKGFKNYIINGDFAINQRVFAGGALAAGVYGFDRWKAGTGGCNVSLAAGVLTHTSGPLVQVIEAPNLAGQTITVSVEGLSGGNLSVNVEGVAGVIVASAGRSGVSIAVPGTSTGNVTVTLTPASGAVNYKRVQVELGSVATAFEWRPVAIELALCKRYYEKSYSDGVAPGAIAQQGKSAVAFSGVTAGSNLGLASTQFTASKRIPPATTVYSPVTGAAGKLRDNTNGVDVAGSLAGGATTSFIWWGNTAGGTQVNLDMQWTADAEF